MRSPKRQVNILIKVTPWCSMQSNQSGYFLMRDKRYRTSVFGSGEIASEKLLPLLFSVNYKILTPSLVTLSTFPVKKAGLGLQNLVT